MAEEAVSVAYHGVLVDDGRMEVRELAPSLLAFAEALQQSQSLLFPDDPRIRVEIVGTRQSSFDVDLSIVHTAFEQARSLLSGETATAAANLAQLGGLGVAAIALIVKLGKRAISRREQLENGQVRLILEDGTELVTTSQVLRVYDRSAIRRLFREFVRPLRKEGMDRLEVHHGPDHADVQADDVDAFEIDVDGEIVTDSTGEIVLQMSAAEFKRDNKWRLTDGNRTWWVSIQDDQFLDRVERDVERFAKNDLLRMRLRTVQYRNSNGKLKTEHFAEQVQHLSIAEAEQTALFGQGEPSSEDLG